MTPCSAAPSKNLSASDHLAATMASSAGAPCKISNLVALRKWKSPSSAWLLAFPLFAARTVSLPLDRREYLKDIAVTRRCCCSLEVESNAHRPARRWLMYERRVAAMK
jgi:hypothetical protein